MKQILSLAMFKSKLENIQRKSDTSNLPFTYKTHDNFTELSLHI